MTGMCGASCRKLRYMRAYPVGRQASKVRNNNADLLEPIAT
jgi:hypothetical protein